MQRPELDRRLVAFCLALVVGACFGGEFAQGLPCERDADCGPGLRCVKEAGASEGLCGGRGGLACGNGLLDADEECDDGNDVDSDCGSERAVQARSERTAGGS